MHANKNVCFIPVWTSGTAMLMLLIWFAGSPALGQEGDNFSEVSVDRAKEIIDSQGADSQVVLLDTRTKPEYEKDHLKNAVFFDFGSDDFWEKINALDKNKTYLVYCFDGGRSGKTVQYMKENGFREVHNIEGGIIAWKRAGYPVIRD